MVQKFRLFFTCVQPFKIPSYFWFFKETLNFYSYSDSDESTFGRTKLELENDFCVTSLIHRENRV